jgi:hypothetical protein
MHKYRILLGAAPSVVAASDEEWKDGTEILRSFVGDHVKALIDGPSPTSGGRLVKSDPRPYHPNGRLLAKSGDIWLGIKVAPDNRYAALLSFDGWWDGARAPRDGHFYIDVYNLETSRRVALLNGYWTNWNFDDKLAQLQWVTNRDLLLPFGDLGEYIVACQFG